MKKIFNFLNKYKFRIMTILCATSALACFTCAWFALSTRALSTFAALLTGTFASTVIAGSFAYLEFGWNDYKNRLKNTQKNNQDVEAELDEKVSEGFSNYLKTEKELSKGINKNLTPSHINTLNNIDKKSTQNYRTFKKPQSTEETTSNLEEDLTI